MNTTPQTREVSEKREAEYDRLYARIHSIFETESSCDAALQDSITTFKNLGLSGEQAIALFLKIKEIFREKNLPDAESSVLELFRATKVGGKNLVTILDEKLKGRAELIYRQISPYMKTPGPVLDFGAGDLQVTQMLQDRDGLNIIGVDVRNYRKETEVGNPVPFELYDGKSLRFDKRSFDTVLATNVLHHAGETSDTKGSTEDNEAALHELCRVANNTIVVIETVPDPALAKQNLTEAMERTFWNDYLYNRLFHSADVPVPGRYETMEDWPKRFLAHGWELVETIDLQYDQPTIRDYHVLYVFHLRKNIYTISSDTAHRLSTTI